VNGRCMMTVIRPQLGLKRVLVVASILVNARRIVGRFSLAP
jgi:hypothetical protein